MFTLIRKSKPSFLFFDMTWYHLFESCKLFTCRKPCKSLGQQLVQKSPLMSRLLHNQVWREGHLWHEGAHTFKPLTPSTIYFISMHNCLLSISNHSHVDSLYKMQRDRHSSVPICWLRKTISKPLYTTNAWHC